MKLKKQIITKIAKKISNKVAKNIPLSNFFINKGIEYTIDQSIESFIDMLEKNPDALEQVSLMINKIEDAAMDITASVDDIPVVRDLARGAFEGWKTFGKATDYPTNVLNEVGKNLFDQKNYQAVNNPLDVVENVSKVQWWLLEGVGKTTVNTVRDVGYGVQDTVIKIFNPISFLWK